MESLYRIAAPCFAVIMLAGSGMRSDAVTGQPDLPNRIFLKTATETFTRDYYFVMRDGRIHYRSCGDYSGKSDGWKLFPLDGRPGRGGVFGFAPPGKVVAISADGDNLVAVGDDSIVYYVKLYDLVWTNKWGMIPKGKLTVIPGVRALAMSHRGKNLAGYYEDIFGIKHPMGAGVTTVYLLTGDGGKILYADPWLPPLFDNNLCMPLKGRFIAANMSASASTVFVINAAGEMYTRLYDYDTAGENPVLSYTYDRNDTAGPKSKKKRGLPPEEWRRQPPIKGKITDVITIVQTGSGNAARELRVEGLDGKGGTGYYRKPLYSGEWEFVPTGRPLRGKILAAEGASPLGPKLTRDYDGRLRRSWSRETVPAKLADFSFLCEGGTLRIEAGGILYNIPLYLRRVRADGKEFKARGMMALPDAMMATAGKEAKYLRETIFHGKKYIKATVAGTEKSLRISFRGGEITFP